MKGKGFSSCLMCESQTDLLMGSQLVLNIIRKRFTTDVFDVMLQNTKICMKCIGRLQQLNEFCANNEFVAPSSSDDNDIGKKLCYMCRLPFSFYEILPPNKSIANEIDRNKWLKNWNQEEELKVICCYSCYNFTLLYSETKDQLSRLLDYYYSALSNCKVLIKDCEQKDDQPKSLANAEQFFGSLSLTPVERSNRSQRSRVNFASEVEMIPEPPMKKLKVPPRNLSFKSLPTAPHKTNSFENINSIGNKAPARIITRKLRNSIGGLPRTVSPILPKIHRSRYSTGSKVNTPNLEILKKENNLKECVVSVERLQVIPGRNDSDNGSKGSAKKKPIKIKVSAKSKLEDRKMKRSLRLKKDKTSDELENSLNLEVVMTEDNLNNSQSSTMSVDPLNASENDSSLLDKTLLIPSPEHSTEPIIQAKDEDNNNKVSSKENNDLAINRSTRKTRNSAGKLTESTNVPENNRVIKKRETKTTKTEKDLISPMKDLEVLEPESNENVNLIEDGACEEYLSSHEAVTFQSTINNEELDLLSASQENFSSLSTEDLNIDNAEYLEESLEEIMNTRHSPQNDALCPIYTMDQLLNEDSLLSVT
ncbi:hypothetical protein ACKWTF_007734 [Chironomus riparius]